MRSSIYITKVTIINRYIVKLNLQENEIESKRQRERKREREREYLRVSCEAVVSLNELIPRSRRTEWIRSSQRVFESFCTSRFKIFELSIY